MWNELLQLNPSRSFQKNNRIRLESRRKKRPKLFHRVGGDHAIVGRPNPSQGLRKISHPRDNVGT